MSEAGQDRNEKIDKLEKLIAILKTMSGTADEAKTKEDEPAAEKKKPPANTIAKGHGTLARVGKDAEEKFERHVAAAKASRQREIEAIEQLGLSY